MRGMGKKQKTKTKNKQEQSETRMTARVLKQDPDTKKGIKKKVCIYFDNIVSCLPCPDSNPQPFDHEFTAPAFTTPRFVNQAAERAHKTTKVNVLSFFRGVIGATRFSRAVRVSMHVRCPVRPFVV